MLLNALTSINAYAQTETGTCGKNATYEFKNGVLTISGSGTIGRGVKDKDQIEKVVINEGITIIGESGFSHCSNLKEVIMPQSLTGIKQYAFNECIKLEKADLPSNLKYVGTKAFYECKSLKKIELPESLKTIYESAFNGCSSVTGTLTIPKNTVLKSYAFNYCRGITKLVFEDGFTMGNLANGSPTFAHCEKLTSVYIPGSFKYIPAMFFNNCTSLKEVVLSEGVESVSGFYNCTALEKIVLPKSTKTIYSAAFTGCEKLSVVKIQSKLNNVFSDCFVDCPSLKSIKIPFGVDEVGMHALGYSIKRDSETGSIKGYEPIKSFKIYGKKCKALTDYCKDNDLKFIDMYDVKNATATMKSQTYNGSAKKPSVTVKLAGTTLKKDTDYTVKYSNNTKVGTAKVTITGKGTYKGTLEKTFKINPKPTELTKLTPKSKSFKAYWKKNKSQTSGYQIQYSVYKSFKNAKKVTVKGYKTGARTVKDLKANKKYFVRVRAYKVVDGKKYYSKWSETKSIKTM